MNYTRVRSVFFRYFYDFYKGLHFLADLVYWPLIDILLWGLTMGWIQQQNELPFLPLIIMTALVFWQITRRGAIDISMSLLVEFWNRNLVNLFSTPLKIYEWIAGVLLLSLCKLLITIAFGAGIVYLLYSLNIFMIGWTFLPFVAALVIFGWIIGFLAASLIINWGHQMEAVVWMLPFVFAPFSAVFYPVDMLPAWGQVIAWCIPTTYIFEGMRQIISTGSFPFYFFWVSLGLDLLYLGLSIVLFEKMFEKRRQKGIARLE